jgi:hypothetical protein
VGKLAALVESTLRTEVSGPSRVLSSPIVGQPFVDSMVRGLLLRIDLTALKRRPNCSASGNSHFDCIIEAEAHAGLTPSVLSRRALRQRALASAGLPRYLGVPPTAYSRDVQFRRAASCTAGV